MLSRRCFAVLYLSVVIVLGLFLALARRHSSPASTLALGSRKVPVKSGPEPPRLISSTLAHIPLSFEEARSQAGAGAGAEFVSRGPGYALSLGPDGAVLEHRAKVRLNFANSDFLSSIAAMRGSEQTVSSEVRLTWLGANPKAHAEGVDRQRGTSNYILGNDPKKWRRSVPHYGKVRLASLYSGIDLVYHGNQDRVEMDYIVAPKAAPTAIRIGIGGPSIVTIDPQGNLSISSAGDEVLLRAPVAYQEKGGKREIVDARYVLEASHTVGFSLGKYDPSQPLIIDPVLDFAASFGGSDDIISDVVTDASGNIYITGTTCSVSYPVTGSALKQSGGSTTALACNDVIVTKLDPSASSLIYSTFIGGSSVDLAVRMLVDSSGDVLLAGSTASPDFPTTSGVYQATPKGGTCSYGPYMGNQACADGFLLKLNPTGSQLLFSTLLGGERLDFIMALAENPTTGNIYVAGATNSTQFPIAVPASAPQPAYGGDNGKCQMIGTVTAPCMDAFVAELNSTGSTLLASTYLGGSDDDGALAIALDKNGNVYVTGGAESLTFPTTAGAYQTTHHSPGEQSDVFVTELNSSLSKPLIYSTFIGGTKPEFGTRIRVDSTRAAYVTGSTSSADFPVFPTPSGTVQETYAGPSTMDCPEILDSAAHGQLYCGDVFVAKVAPGGGSLVFSTYLGGSADEGALNMALDSSNNVWVIGTTQSTDYPLSSPYYSSASIGQAFLSEISADGTQNLFSTRLPGQQGLAIQIDAANNVFVAGEYATNTSLNPALATPGTYSNGQGGIFLMEFSPGTATPAVTLSSTSSAFAGNTITFPNTQPDSASTPVPVTLRNTGTGTLHLSISTPSGNFGANPQAFVETNDCGSSVAPGSSCTIQAIYEPSATGTNDSARIVISDDAPNAPHVISMFGGSQTTLTASFVPNTLDFGRRAAGTTSGTKSSSVTGTGQLGPMTLGAFTLGGDTADFTITGTSCAVGQFYCSATADFSPQAGATPGAKMMTFSVPTTGPGGPQVLTLTGTVTTSPVLAVSVNPVNFSPVDQGQIGSVTMGLSNPGGATLTISGMTFSNPAFSYDTTSPCGSNPTAINVAPQQACLLFLRFAPVAPTIGIQTGTLTFASNDPSAPVVNITGDATTPSSAHLVFTPSTDLPFVNGSYQFADTIVGQSTAPIASLSSLLNLNTSGTGGSATITRIALSNSDFTLDQVDTASLQGCPPGTVPITLTAGNACMVSVYFTPRAPGLRTGSLTIQATDATGTSTFTANFSGNAALEPGVALSPIHLSFGKLAIAQTSAPLTSVLTNTGGAPLLISNITTAAPFSQTNNCPASLPAGAACSFSVTFTPGAAAPAAGLLAFATNAAGGNSAIGLSGSGVSGAFLAAQPGSLSFIGQEIGTASPEQSVTLENTGGVAASISAVHTTTNFKQTNNCPASLAPRASCTVNVTFDPTADNFPNFTVNGTVLVDNSGQGSPLAIPITATSLASTAAATTTTVVSSANPSTVGQTVSFTASVSSTIAGSPMGNVTIYDGTTQLIQQFITSVFPTVTYQTSNLSPGPHLIHATFNGDLTFNSSVSNFLTQIENTPGKTATSTAVMSSANPSNTGQAVMFTATVTPASGTTVATGSVTFTDGGVVLGSGALDSTGKATLSTSTLSSGDHNIFAEYGGDANYNGSGSMAVSQVVNSASKTNTSTVLASSLNPSNSGQSVTFTATVTPSIPSSGATVATGNVTFSDGATTLGTSALDNTGKATLTTSALVATTHTITAAYNGDVNFNASQSNTVMQMVNGVTTKTNTSTNLVSSPNPSNVGQSVTFTATVTPLSGTTVPAGSLSFTDGTNSLGLPMTLDGTGKATLITSLLATGSHSITAVYAGNSSFNGSTSNTVSQVVNAGSSSPDFSVSVQQSSLTVKAGTSGTLNVTVTPQNGFNQTVAISCSGLPVHAGCNAASATPDGVHPASTTVTVTTMANAAAPGLPRAPVPPTGTWFVVVGIASLALLALIAVCPRRLRMRLVLTGGLAIVAVALLSCGSSGGYGGGGGGSTGTPPGTYAITITGASGSTVHNAPATVTLTVN